MWAMYALGGGTNWVRFLLLSTVISDRGGTWAER